MANVQETPSYDAGIYQIETTDPVLGGVNGIANAQAKGLANRTAFLKQQIDQLKSGQLKPDWIASTDYVQGELQKLDAKQSVRAATLENITLSGAQTIDGVTLTVGDRVLVKDQTNAAQNGIYLVAAQSWTRAPDANDASKLNFGATIAVEAGVVNGNTRWHLATPGALSIGNTAIEFTTPTAPTAPIQDSSTKTANTKFVNDLINDKFTASLINPGWRKISSGEIEQWGTVTLGAIGNYNAEQIGGATFYTNYYSITYPIAFPELVLEAECTIACATSSGQLGMAGKTASLNMSGTGNGNTGMVIAITSPTIGYIPTVHWQARGK